MIGLHLDLGRIRAYGSAYLASILYQNEYGDFIYTLDSSSNMILDNQSMGGEANDGLIYSGRGIELGATNDVDIPIHHTLETDKNVQAFSATVGDDTGSASVLGQIATFNINGTGTQSGGAIAEWRDSPFVVVPQNTTYKILVDIVISSGAFKPFQFRYGERTVGVADIGLISGNEYTSSFTHTFEFTTGNQASLSQPIFYSYNTVAGSYTIEIQSIEQITNPNSYLTYYDFTDGLVTVDNSLNTPSTKYTLNTKTVNNFLTHTTPWSASDWTKINNNLNLIGKLAIETTGVTKTIPELDMVMDAGASADHYYMCSEKSSGYLVDSRVAYGVSNDATGTWTAQNAEGSTSTTDNTTHHIVKPDLAAVSSGRIVSPINVVLSGTPKYMAFDVSIVSGSLMVRTSNSEDSFGFGQITSSGSYAIVNDCASSGTTLEFWAFTTAATDITITNVEVRSATATEVSNYASTVRTNADFQQKGIQTTAFVTDGAGVPTAYSSDLLQFNGDGRYIDTGWIPDLTRDFTFSNIEETSGNSLELSGTGVFGATDFRFGYSGASSNAYLYANGTNIPFTVTKGIPYQRHIVNDASANTLSMYINGAFVNSISTVGAGITGTVFIGKTQGDTLYFFSRGVGIPLLYIDKALTASEVATSYTQAKLIYPSLP